MKFDKFGHKVVLSFPYYPFNVSRVWKGYPIPHTGNLYLLFGQSCQRLVDFTNLSKEPALCFIDILYCFCFNYMDFCSVFPSFCLLIWGFSRCLKLKLVFEIFPLLHHLHLVSYISLSALYQLYLVNISVLFSLFIQFSVL